MEAKEILKRAGYLMEAGRDTRFKRNVIDFDKLDSEPEVKTNSKSSKYETIKNAILKKNGNKFPSQDDLEKMGFELFGDPRDKFYYYVVAKPGRDRTSRIFGEIFDDEIQIDIEDLANRDISLRQIFAELEKQAVNKYL